MNAVNRKIKRAIVSLFKHVPGVKEVDPTVHVVNELEPHYYYFGWVNYQKQKIPFHIHVYFKDNAYYLEVTDDYLYSLKLTKTAANSFSGFLNGRGQIGIGGLKFWHDILQIKDLPIDEQYLAEYRKRVEKFLGNTHYCDNDDMTNPDVYFANLFDSAGQTELCYLLHAIDNIPVKKVIAQKANLTNLTALEVKQAQKDSTKIKVPKDDNLAITAKFRDVLKQNIWELRRKQPDLNYSEIKISPKMILTSKQIEVPYIYSLTGNFNGNQIEITRSRVLSKFILDFTGNLAIVNYDEKQHVSESKIIKLNGNVFRIFKELDLSYPGYYQFDFLIRDYVWNELEHRPKIPINKTEV